MIKLMTVLPASTCDLGYLMVLPTRMMRMPAHFGTRYLPHAVVVASAKTDKAGTDAYPNTFLGRISGLS